MTGYIFAAGVDRAFSPDGKVSLNPDQIAAHNAALQADELSSWAAAPERFAAYVLQAEVGHRGRQPRRLTTWQGATLGHVVSFRHWRMPQGCQMTSVRVRGTNGATYVGRYGSDWSELVRLRRIKG